MALRSLTAVRLVSQLEIAPFHLQLVLAEFCHSDVQCSTFLNACLRSGLHVFRSCLRYIKEPPPKMEVK